VSLSTRVHQIEKRVQPPTEPEEIVIRRIFYRPAGPGEEGPQPTGQVRVTRSVNYHNGETERESYWTTEPLDSLKWKDV
jgi:hypothetical protein